MRDIFQNLQSLFLFDALALIMIALITFLGISIAFFSNRYLRYDTHKGKFLTQLAALVLSTCVMATADHILLFWAAITLSNFLLVKLMVHSGQWQAANVSGKLALRNFGLVSIFLSLAFCGLYNSTGSAVISEINKAPESNTIISISLLLLIFGALAQSALYPFHKWILSSLNSPTPVSAIMHAGIINGGGIIVTRFAPLLMDSQLLLGCLFLIGLFTAIFGTLLKLIQSDIKRMLASSTMAQMGFMFVQCGLGLFSNAIAHLCLHGMFKAYLFLGHANLLKVNEMPSQENMSLKSFIFAILFGLIGSMFFAYGTHAHWMSNSTTLVQNLVSFLLCAQVSLTIMGNTNTRTVVSALIISSIYGYFYGNITHLFEWLLSDMSIYVPQPLNTLHIIGMSVLVAGWVFVGVLKRIPARLTGYYQRLYVILLNNSQPHPESITAIRSHYQFQ